MDHSDRPSNLTWLSPTYIVLFGFYHDHVWFPASMASILTLIMFPILVIMYVRLAKIEERDMHAEFGKEYEAYAAKTPGFVPRLNG